MGCMSISNIPCTPLNEVIWMQLAHVADVNKSLLETYINHHEENRLKEPF